MIKLICIAPLSMPKVEFGEQTAVLILEITNKEL